MKHWHNIIVIFTLSICCSAVSAKDGGARARFIYGLDWGYSNIVSQWHHANYISSDGFRVNQINTDFNYAPNGYCRGYAGINFPDKWALAVYGGFNGISKGRTASSFSARLSFAPSGWREDGLKFFAEDGIALTETFKDKIDRLWAAGGGYRLQLSEGVGLDLSVSVQVAYDHPLRVYDKYSGELLRNENIRKSEAVYTALNIGLALSF